MESLDWQEIIGAIQAYATSEKAKLNINNISNFSTEEEAHNRLSEIIAAQKLMLETQQRPFFEALDLFDSWYLRLSKKAKLNPLDLKDIRRFCFELIAFRSLLNQNPSTWSQQQLSQTFDCEDNLSAIDQIITPQGEIRSDASEKLYRLFKEKDQLAKNIQTHLDRFVKDHDIQEYLQDRFITTREGRWVIPVKSGRQHAISGVIHGASQTKQTVYLEPDKIIPINNRLREVEVEIEEEIERLLVEISDYLSRSQLFYHQSHITLLHCDQIYAFAQFSDRVGAKAFEFSKNKFKIENTFHPLLTLQGRTPVPNTVEMGPQSHILLLSGPNAGGKTLLMKSIGLVCHMARCGLPVCASSAEIPFIKQILVGIGDSQKVNEELSTFAAHLQLLNHCVQLKGFENLILIDEIASSTDPEEGSALAKAFIEEFSKNKIYAVITSHLNQLKSGWDKQSGVLPGSLEFDLSKGSPTYQFLPGVPGQSLAIEMAKKLKVSPPIIERAYHFLSPQSKQRLSLLSETESLKQDLILLQESLKKAKKEAEEQKLLYQNKQAELESTAEKRLEKLTQEARQKIDTLLAELKASDSFERHRKSQDIKIQLPEIIKSSPHSTRPSNLNPVTKETFSEFSPPGSRVFIKSMNREGIVQSQANQKGEVMVLVDSMRVALPWTELSRTSSHQNPTQNILRQSGIFTPLSDTDPQVDLRGLTVSEALEKIELALDQSLRVRQTRLKIVHGVGTEALKKALRSHLTRSSFVRKWTQARPEEGGEGVTWIEVDLD